MGALADLTPRRAAISEGRPSSRKGDLAYCQPLLPEDSLPSLKDVPEKIEALRVPYNREQAHLALVNRLPQESAQAVWDHP